MPHGGTGRGLGAAGVGNAGAIASGHPARQRKQPILAEHYEIRRPALIIGRLHPIQLPTPTIC